MKVKDPPGNVWRVTRRWLPWRRRLPAKQALDRRAWDVLSTSDFGLDGPLGLALLAISVIIFMPGLILLIVAGLEFLALVLLLPIAVLARMAFSSRWHVEVRMGFTSWHEEPAGNWSEAGERIATLADDIEQGYLPPPTLVNEPPPEPF